MRHFYYTNQCVNSKEARRLELIIEAQTGLHLENPFFDSDAKESKTVITMTKEKLAKGDAGKPKLSADEIVGRDLRKIRESEGIVAMMTSEFCVGSVMEIAIAAFSWGKPVYVIARNPYFRVHPWIKYFASHIFDDVHAFIEYAKENLQ